MTGAPALEERIAAVLADPEAATADGVESLRAAVARRTASAESEVQEARKAARDPCLSDAAAKRAQEEAERLEFRRDRWRSWSADLADLAEALRGEEAEAERRRRFAEAVAIRDRVAEKIRDVYPGIAAQLLDLIDEIGRARMVVDDANASLECGGPPLHHAEAVAFQYPDAPGEQVFDGEPPRSLLEVPVLNLASWSEPFWDPTLRGGKRVRKMPVAISEIWRRERLTGPDTEIQSKELDP
jgi:hypothetical protein